MTAETAAPKQKVRLSTNYWRLWTASVISNLGDGIAFIAYPWLASAVTRNALLISLIAVAQRLPWLFFTLPAGVITDRVDRRKLMLTMDVFRTLVTLVVAATVVGASSRLPGADQVAGGLVEGTDFVVYSVLLVASLLFGMAEVLRDNAAQTFLPAIVKPENLERANGNLWGAETVANQFLGPPIGSLLLGIGFAIPFFIDAGTFAVAAALIFVIAGDFRTRERTQAQSGARVDWKGEIKEGFMWLWKHPVLRPMAIILGLLNALAMMTFATFILFAQENLDLQTGLFTGVLRPVADFFGADGVATFVFALLMMSGALGGVAGSVLASRISRRLGSGTSLYVSIAVWIATTVVIGLASRWWIAAVMFIVNSVFILVWNVITVSFRQTIIPDSLLGRVNSVYRFFGWGMMPFGSLLGGVVVALGEVFLDRSDALRLPFLVAGVVYVFVFLYALPRLSTEKLEAARAEVTGSSEPAGFDAEDVRDALSESGTVGLPPDDLDEQA